MAADTPKIVLTPQERSHYFNRRECVATEPLKVGRSVDRRRISPNNLIFDCRVLSRNHAQIWFENGKFFIKDTKSSNGTFVNETRLSPSSEESGPVELKSRDVVQFGVNVNVDKKVTHGCIIATVKLYINDVEVPGHEPPVQQVMQILMSALTREQELETKLASMQSVLNIARELATDSMIAIVKEDELMSRLEMLENQLQVYSRNASDDELKKQLARAFEEKHKNDLSSKDSLRGILQEKLECVSKLSQLQRDYDKAEQDCQRYRTMLDEAKDEHSLDVAKLGEKLKTYETERKEIESKLTEEKKNLAMSLESLQEDADHTKSQLDKAKARLSETETELLELRIAMEAVRQREAKGMLTSTADSSISGTGDPIIPPGTAEDPLTMESSLVPPGTEDPVEVSSKSITKLGHSLVTEKIEKEAAMLVGSSSSPALPLPSPLINQETIIASSSYDCKAITSDLSEKEALKAKLVSLEMELESSQARVKALEEQLCVSSSTSLPPKGPFTTDMVKLAKRLSDSAISKGQLEVLQQSLLEAENLIVELKAQKASSDDMMPPDSRGIHDSSHQDTTRQDSEELESREVSTILRLKDEIRDLKDNTLVLESRLLSAEQECRLSREEKNQLEIELSVVNTRFSSESQDNFRLRKENEDLGARNEDMERRIDELRATIKKYEHPSAIKKVCSSSESNLDSRSQLQRLQEELKHAKILTIIALVSIGVALASWLL